MKRQGFTFINSRFLPAPAQPTQFLRGQFSQMLLTCILLLLLLSGCVRQTPPAPQPTSSPTPASTATSASAQPATPTPGITPTPCGQQQGMRSIETLPSAVMGEGVQYTLYLPPCYPATAPDNGYPVLYLLHGQGMDHQFWSDLGLLDAADRLIAAGDIQPVIIVMPTEKYTLQDPEPSKFPAVLLDELLPWIESHYNTCTRPECRLLGGISRGANWSIRLGLQHPELFGSLGGHSLTVFYGDSISAPGWIEAISAAEMPRIWLDMGEKDPYRDSYEQFVAMLNKNQVRFSENTTSGGHNAAYWTAHLEEYLRWYAGDE